jgi:hypothetical protein
VIPPLTNTRFNNELRYADGNDQRQWYLTPPYVLDKVRRDLGGTIDLDPCTFPDNPTDATEFYTVVEDGLSRDWEGAVFCNPPYGKAREPWVRKCIAHSEWLNPVILLIPAATDTRIFREAAQSAEAIVFVSGRLKFGTLRENRRQHAASHPSALIGWNTTLWECSTLGWRAEVRSA